MAKSSPPCSYERPSGERTGRRISTGASSRTGGSTAAGWCSVMCSTSARSIPRKQKLGAGRSRCSTRTPAGRARWRCSPRIVARFGRRRRGAVAAQRDAALPATPIWRLLARGRSVEPVAARSILGGAPAAQPQGHALGSCAASAGGLSAHRSGQRVAAASPMVSRQRYGRSSWRRTSASPKPTSSTPATTCCWPTNRLCSRI